MGPELPPVLRRLGVVDMHVENRAGAAAETGASRVPAPRGNGRAHRLFHPLCGATPDILLRLLCKGGVRPGRLHVVATALAMTALRLPFTLGEAAVVELLFRLQPEPGPAPVFVIGHWRSGTTHLTNLLSRSASFGILSPMSVGLPAEALSLARLARPLIEQYFPRNRLIDDMPLRADLPQEDELAMANLSTLSCNHGLYFPGRLQGEFDRGVFLDGVGTAELRRWRGRLTRYVAKMTRAAGGRPLLIRNPANSARIPLLRAIWPEARFVHIHRDPADVCASSVRMFATLIRELSLGPVADAEAQAAGLVQAVYPRLMTALRRDSATVPPGRFVEIRYEALRQQPMREVERVHQSLGLVLSEPSRRSMQHSLGAAALHVPSRAAPDAPVLHWLHDHPEIFRAWDYALPGLHGQGSALDPLKAKP